MMPNLSLKGCHWVFSKLSLVSLISRSRVTETWQALTPTAGVRKHCPPVKPHSTVFYIIESSKNVKRKRFYLITSRVLKWAISTLLLRSECNHWRKREPPSTSVLHLTLWVSFQVWLGNVPNCFLTTNKDPPPPFVIKADGRGSEKLRKSHPTSLFSSLQLAGVDLARK